MLFFTAVFSCSPLAHTHLKESWFGSLNWLSIVWALIKKIWQFNKTLKTLSWDPQARQSSTYSGHLIYKDRQDKAGVDRYDWQAKKTKLLAENVKMNGSIISWKKITWLHLHSAALDSLTEDLQYKTGLVLVSNNLRSNVETCGSIISNKTTAWDLKVPFLTITKTLCNIIKKNPWLSSKYEIKTTVTTGVPSR